MRHPKIDSISEPWLLLPLAYSMKGYNGVLAPYDHTHAQDAIDNLIEELPQGKFEFYQELSNFVCAVYKKLSIEKNNYFLEKTPRYFLIIPFIKKLFPDAKYIFLFRHPLAIFASIINTWGNGRLRSLYTNYVDLYDGQELLAAASKEMKNKSIQVFYEDLVSQPDRVIRRIFDYLELQCTGFEFSPVSGNLLHGQMGDKTGVSKYNTIDDRSSKSWEQTFNNRFRIWLATKYINSIGANVLSCMGYSLNDILNDIKNIDHGNKIDLKDILDFCRINLYRKLNSEVSRKAVRKLLIP